DRSRSRCGSRWRKRGGCRSTRRRACSPTEASARWPQRREIDSARELHRMSERVTVADYFERAAETVDPQVWCFFEGGSGDEVTLRANARAYSRWRLRPRMLVDVS